MIEQPHYLYVEDDQKSREVMRLMMDRVVKDCQLTVMEDGVDFIARLSQLKPPPTMILLDIHMQPCDGFTLLEQLRAAPQFAGIPVVALTASVMNEEVDRLRTSGFSGVIAKPISPRTFPGILKQLLEGESVWYITE